MENKPLTNDEVWQVLEEMNITKLLNIKREDWDIICQLLKNDYTEEEIISYLLAIKEYKKTK